MSGSPRPRVLLVDDDRRSAGLLAKMLRDDGYDVEVAVDGAAALARLTRSPTPDALLTELHLPHADGVAVARYARSRRPTIPVFLLTGYPQGLDATNTVEPAPAVLTKPFDYAELLDRLGGALGLHPRP